MTNRRLRRLGGTLNQVSQIDTNYESEDFLSSRKRADNAAEILYRILFLKKEKQQRPSDSEVEV